jgi:hypothetical protein
MKLDVDDDWVDEIISRAIMQSYLWIKADLKKEKQTPGTHHEDDVANWKVLLPALEEVGKYFTFDWEGKLKAMKKANK